MPDVRDARLAAIYARLPRLECWRLCQEACGPIAMFRPEWDRLVEFLMYEPKPTPDQVRRLRCPLLDEASGRCTVYSIRPMICRLFGLVERMRCPFGCVPERWLSDQEARDLMDQVDRIGK